MKHQLKNPYIAVRTEAAESYGGNQAWLSTKWQRGVGCGLVAAQDIVSYLKGGEQVVSMEKYLEDMEQTVKFFPIKSPMGLNGFMLAWGVNRMLKKSELPFRARWSVGRKRFLKRLPEMLKDDIPALLSVGPGFFHRKERLPLYHKDASGAFTRANSMRDHYVTVTGWEQVEDVKWLHISSWGESFYVNLEEYLEHVKKYDNFLFSSILYIRRIEK